MAEGKHYRLSHFVPDGHPQVFPGHSAEVKAMMPELIKKAPRGWTKVPNHDLEVFATRKGEVPCLGFRKNGKEVYVHVFCNEFMNPFYAIQIVFNLYTKFKLGKPTFLLEELNWIHTIPIAEKALSPAETMFIHQLTQSMFWTIYMDYKRRSGSKES
jgi:hypothetical protein